MTSTGSPDISGSIKPDWIAVDWGTTHLRAWLMQGDQVLGQAASNDGMASLSRDGFEPALLKLVGGWLSSGNVTPVIACGMVGSRQGWIEAPYVTVPCAPLSAANMVRGVSHDPRIDVWVVPGLRQDAPADVMRGEETQIAGLLATEPELQGIVCLPGTHTKWVSLKVGEVQDFSTFMTGELYALISGHTVLRHGLGSASDWHQPSFEAAVREALQAPAGLAAGLFRLRAEGLLHAMPAEAARARLSGLLIGNELAAIRARLNGPVTLVGAPGLSALYAAALVIAGYEPRIVDGANLTLAGLSLARESILEDIRRPQ